MKKSLNYIPSFFALNQNDYRSVGISNTVLGIGTMDVVNDIRGIGAKAMTCFLLASLVEIPASAEVEPHLIDHFSVPLN